MESRFLMVTALSSRESKSTVTHSGGPDLVLASVSAPDGLGVVVLGTEIGSNRIEYLLGQGKETLVAAERQHGDLDGAEVLVELQEDSGLAAYFFFAVGIDEEGEGGAVHAPRGLDNEGGDVLFCLLIKDG